MDPLTMFIIWMLSQTKEKHFYVNHKKFNEPPNNSSVVWEVVKGTHVANGSRVTRTTEVPYVFHVPG